MSIYRSTQTLTNVETEYLVEATVVIHYVNVHSCLFTSWKLCASDRWNSLVGMEIRLYHFSNCMLYSASCKRTCRI